MKHIYPIFDITDAKQKLENTHVPVSQYMKQIAYYSPAYLVSNEPLRFSTGLTANMARRVLTVTGSGDQALFYSLAGAEQIDTFDISFCAKTVMDIKTAALKQLPLEEYKQLLNELRKSEKPAEIKNMHNILPQLSENSVKLINTIPGLNIPNCVKMFDKGFSPSNYPENLPTESEYAQLREKVQTPFKFIWTDVSSLHTYLTGEYDVINLSNIFEWTPNLTIPTLASLRNYVRPGGYILAQTSWIIPNPNMQKYAEAQEKFKRWAKIGIIKDPKSHDNIVILQRTR